MSAGAKRFEREMRALDLKVQFWLGFTVGAGVMGVVLIFVQAVAS